MQQSPSPISRETCRIGGRTGTTYFVTFRTADSLPKQKLREWEAERAEWSVLRSRREPHRAADRKELFPATISAGLVYWLDQGIPGLRPRQNQH